MPVGNVLAVLPVTNFDGALVWYGQLFGRPADNRPMEGLAEWRLTDTGGVQVSGDPGNAGGTSVSLIVDDLEEHVAGLDRAGIGVSPITAGDMARFAAVLDPEGNTITFAEPIVRPQRPITPISRPRQLAPRGR